MLFVCSDTLGHFAAAVVGHSLTALLACCCQTMACNLSMAC